ncbi:MAG: tetratricopeptide repeat protein [Gemmatimonadota bacterium]
MPTPFLSSEEYDERAHLLYNEGKYETALDVLREGLALYPNAVELHIGIGYARLAREEFAWARRSFEEALALDADHEDALAGNGEVLLRIGQTASAIAAFRKTIELGYEDDLELMLQVGRALFRDGQIDEAAKYFRIASRQAPDSAEALALVGYVEHRMGDDERAVRTLKRALQLDPSYTEARIYLGNVLYDAGDLEAALYHLDRSSPSEHWDELGIWRLIELKKSVHKLPDSHVEIRKWEQRLADLAGETDDIDAMLAEIEQRALESEQQDARQQLELFGAMLTGLVEQRAPAEHRILMRDGRAFHGTWDDIVRQMKDGSGVYAARSVQDYMMLEARRGFSMTGVIIPTMNAESFIRGSADAGLLRILR